MQLLTLKDIHSTVLYEEFRDDFRRKIIDLKKHRRISIGDRVTLVFENRQTLIFQIQEILRAEHIVDVDKIQEEIEIYNPLLPTEDSLSATLFLEVPPEANAYTELNRLIGLDEYVHLHVGAHIINASFEQGRSTEDRISAVQYTRYIFTEEQKHTFCQQECEVSLHINHPQYQHQIPLTQAMHQSLINDLTCSY